MKNTLNNKNYINIYQYFGQKVRQAERPPKIDEIIILQVYTLMLIGKNFFSNPQIFSSLQNP